MFHSGIAQQLSESDRDDSGHSTPQEGKEAVNEDRIKELSDKDTVQEEGQGVSSAKDEEESETEEERDKHFDDKERETTSAVVCTQA